MNWWEFIDNKLIWHKNIIEKKHLQFYMYFIWFKKDFSKMFIVENNKDIIFMFIGFCKVIVKIYILLKFLPKI